MCTFRTAVSSLLFTATGDSEGSNCQKEAEADYESCVFHVLPLINRQKPMRGSEGQDGHGGGLRGAAQAAEP